MGWWMLGLKWGPIGYEAARQILNRLKERDATQDLQQRINALEARLEELARLQAETLSGLERTLQRLASLSIAALVVSLGTLVALVAVLF